MSEARACKECGKMFIPKGREKYCPDVHYRPCPICGKPVVAKYLSDPPGKCEDCKRKKMQPMNKAKSIFNLGSSTIAPLKPVNNEIAKIQPVAPMNHIDTPKEDPKQPEKKPEVKKTKEDKNIVKIDASKVLEPEVFCETYDDKIMKYIGPTIEGYNKFENNHNYKIALTRKDNAYLITSCHDLTTGQEVNCYYLASSQLNISNRFVVVEE